MIVLKEKALCLCQPKIVFYSGVRAFRGFLPRLANAGVNIFALILAATIGGYYPVRWMGFTQFWIIDLIGHILPWLFLPSIVLLPVALLRRSRPLQILVAILGTAERIVTVEV